jgi:hypothetical protein
MKLDLTDDDGVRKHFEATDLTEADVTSDSNRLRDVLKELKSVSITEEEARSDVRKQFVNRRQAER